MRSRAREGLPRLEEERSQFEGDARAGEIAAAVASVIFALSSPSGLFSFQSHFREVKSIRLSIGSSCIKSHSKLAPFAQGTGATSGSRDQFVFCNIVRPCGGQQRDVSH